MDKKFRFNLQLFADGETGEGNTGAADQVTEPAAEPVEKAFSLRLNQERQKLEAQYTPYKGLLEKQAKAAGMTVDEFVAYQEKSMAEEELELESERTGKTPREIQLEQEVNAANDALRKFELKERLTTEEKKLTEDPVIGTFVKSNIEKLREISEANGVDLEIALALVTLGKLPDLIKASQPETHIKAYLESVRNGAKPIEFGGGATTPQPSPPKTFDDARKAATERLKNGG